MAVVGGRGTTWTDETDAVRYARDAHGLEGCVLALEILLHSLASSKKGCDGEMDASIESESWVDITQRRCYRSGE